MCHGIIARIMKKKKKKKKKNELEKLQSEAARIVTGTTKKIKEKSMECHYHKPQPFPETPR